MPLLRGCMRQGLGHICLVLAMSSALVCCGGGSRTLVPVDVREIAPPVAGSGHAAVSTSYLEKNSDVQPAVLRLGAPGRDETPAVPPPGGQVATSDEQVVIRPLDTTGDLVAGRPKVTAIRATPLAEASPTSARDPTQASVRHPAVVGLVAQAERERDAGQLPRAVAAIERALRISPHDAGLWHRLAALRLEQGKTRQAEDFARKSNALAGDDGRLRAANTALIRAAEG